MPAEVALAASTPDPTAGLLAAARAGDGVVVNRVADDAIAVRLEQRRFVGDEQVLAAGLLVEVVRDQDFLRTASAGFTA